MTDTKQQSLIEKIKKLFAIANRAKNNDGSSNEAEAASAMAMAQDLLAKYNLDMRTIQDSVDKTAATGPALGKREQVKVNRSAMYRWQRELWAAIAEANFCFHWVSETSTERYGRTVRAKRHVILGSEANVTVAQMMGEYLTETIERNIPYTGVERLSKSAISWREGCAERLIDRIKAKAQKMKDEGVTVEGSSSTALAVRDMTDAEYGANYDARYGQGAWARKQQREAEYEATREQREAEIDKRYAELQAKEALARQNETPKQREKREAKERREQERWQRRYEREQAREMDKDWSAYGAGKRKGSEINLDSQIKGSAQ